MTTKLPARLLFLSLINSYPPAPVIAPNSQKWTRLRVQGLGVLLLYGVILFPNSALLGTTSTSTTTGSCASHLFLIRHVSLACHSSISRLNAQLFTQIGEKAAAVPDCGVHETSCRSLFKYLFLGFYFIPLIFVPSFWTEKSRQTEGQTLAPEKAESQSTKSRTETQPNDQTVLDLDGITCTRACICLPIQRDEFISDSPL